MVSSKQIKSNVTIFQKLLKVGKVKKYMIILTFIYLLASIINIVVAHFYGELLQIAIIEFKINRLLQILLVYATASVISLVINYLAGLTNAKISMQLVTNYRQKAIDSFINAKFSYIENNKTGDSIGRIINTTKDLAMQVSYFIPDLSRRVLVVVSIVITLFYVSPLIAIIYILLAIITFYFQLWGSQKVEVFMNDMNNKEVDRNALYYELLNNKKTISMFDMEKYIDGWLCDKINTFINAFSNAMAKMILYFSPARILNSIMTIVPYVIGSILVINKDLGFDQFIMLITLIEISSKELVGLDSLFANLPMVLASEKIISAIWDAPQNEIGSIKQLDYNEVLIQINDLTYSYLDNDNIIEDVNLKINCGDKIAIIGKNGCGKSTLLKLISNYYDIKHGEIKLYGSKINEIDSMLFNLKIGYLTQDIFLFNASIKYNLTLDKQVDQNLLNELLQICDLNKFIDKQENGINSIISENMVNISGGEKQRIAIIRELLKQPSILVLDEFSSAIDYKTEEKIMNYICNLSKDITIISTIHKLNYTKLFSRILVMQDKQIIADSTYTKLISDKQSYLSVMLNGGGKNA